MVNVGYQMRDRERHLLEAKKENQVLRMKIATMKSPKNIEAMIRNKDLDLVTTKNWQMIVLPKTAFRGALRTIVPETAETSLLESFHHAEPSARVPMH